MAEPPNGAVFATRLESENAQGLWNNNSLLFVIWWGNTLEDLQPLHCGSATGSLMRDHSADGFVENTRGSTEMERTCETGLDAG